jgi:hypothetical protein
MIKHRDQLPATYYSSDDVDEFRLVDDFCRVCSKQAIERTVEIALRLSWVASDFG